MGLGTTSGSAENDYGLSNPVGGFVEVVRRAVGRPAELFSDIPSRGNYLRPLVFARSTPKIFTFPADF